MLDRNLSKRYNDDSRLELIIQSRQFLYSGPVLVSTGIQKLKEPLGGTTLRYKLKYKRR